MEECVAAGQPARHGSGSSNVARHPFDIAGRSSGRLRWRRVSAAPAARRRSAIAAADGCRQTCRRWSQTRSVTSHGQTLPRAQRATRSLPPARDSPADWLPTGRAEAHSTSRRRRRQGRDRDARIPAIAFDATGQVASCAEKSRCAPATATTGPGVSSQQHPAHDPGLPAGVDHPQ